MSYTAAHMHPPNTTHAHFLCQSCSIPSLQGWINAVMLLCRVVVCFAVSVCVCLCVRVLVIITARVLAQ